MQDATSGEAEAGHEEILLAREWVHSCGKHVARAVLYFVHIPSIYRQILDETGEPLSPIVCSMGYDDLMLRSYPQHR